MLSKRVKKEEVKSVNYFKKKRKLSNRGTGERRREERGEVRRKGAI